METFNKQLMPSGANEVNEVLPSYFKSINNSESHPIVSWQFLYEQIKTDPILKNLTELYRKRLAISKRFADELKPTSPAITAAILTDGYGRQLVNILKPVYKFALDFDKIAADKMSHIKQLVADDPHTFLCYTTISGKGIRIICCYAPVDDPDMSMLELFDLMLNKGMLYYKNLLGIHPDKACIDITRCSGLAYDPDAFFRPEAEPFSPSPLDLKTFYTHKANETKKTKRKTTKVKTAKPAKSIQLGEDADYSEENAPTIEEAAQSIKHLLTQWGKQFEPGRHNDYVSAFGRVCVYYGIAEMEATRYACDAFSADYPDTASVMKSCYTHTERLGTWHFYRKGETFKSRPSVKAIKQWLSTRYEFHRNTVTGFYEMRSLMVLTGKYPYWTRIDDDSENSLWTEMNEHGMHVSTSVLHVILNSDFSTPFDPLEDYLKGLKPWDKDKDPDYIDELANRIEVVEKPAYHHTQEQFRRYFKKWFVAMVVAWIVLKVVNQFILIFVGKGGIFKTTFFSFLLPPQLRAYFINDSTGVYTDKDAMEAFSSKALMCLDEFEIIFGKNLSAFKSNMTKLTFSIRRPYDKYRSELPHRASLCGTTNSMQFITDEENRRYCPWIVKSIQSPLETPIDYDHVYAQAVALGQQVLHRDKSDKNAWTYWLTGEDIEEMHLHNRLFMVANYAEEQILRFYKVPKSLNDSNIKFRYSAEILEQICTNPVMRQNMSTQSIGSIMSRLGFKKIHKRTGNGWAVIEKESLEIVSDSIYDRNDPVED